MSDEQDHQDNAATTAFAAGVATATAAQASEEAEEAGAASETAVAIASDASSTAMNAVDAAEQARDEAAVTRAELDGVREQLGALADAHAELLATLNRGSGGGSGGSESSDTAPAPERKAPLEQAAEDKTESGDKTTGDKPPDKPRYGSKAWFG